MSGFAAVATIGERCRCQPLVIERGQHAPGDMDSRKSHAAGGDGDDDDDDE